MTPELAHVLNQVDSAVLGARIKAARTAAGLTQPELGGAEASVTYVSRIERGERRPGTALLETFAGRLGVRVEHLVTGEATEDVRRLELRLDHADLALAGGEAENALALAREALTDRALVEVPGAPARARLAEAAALEALGDPGAAAALEAVLALRPGRTVALRAATSLSRVLREAGSLDRAISCAREALDGLPEELVGSEEAVRLAVTLAAALFEAGDVEEAQAVCDAAITDADRVSSPVARASAYWNASILRSEAGDVDQALDLARRAIGLLEHTERARDLGRLRMQLGTIMLRADPPQVEEARAQLVIADRELDWSEASPVDHSRNDLLQGRAAFLGDDAEQARERGHRVLEALGDGAPILRAGAMTLLGQVEWRAGERESARDWYRAAIAVLTGIGADREAAQLWFEVGSLADESGLVEEARDAYRRAAASSGLRSRLHADARSEAGTRP